MRNYIKLTLFFSLVSIFANAQNADPSVQVGDVFVVGQAYNHSYEHINFPRLNFIVKRGGMANYKHVEGRKVQVISLKEKKDGHVLATIGLSSKKNFFNSHKYVTVDITEAIRERELVKL